MKTILVLTDFSRAARVAAEAGLRIALSLNAEVLLINSYHISQIILTEPPEKDYAGMGAESKRKLEKERERLSNIPDCKEVTGKPCIRLISSIEPISAVLYDIQQAYKIVLTVMGKHKKSDNNFLFANHIHVALSNSNCPLLIVTGGRFSLFGLHANFASDLDAKDLLLTSQLQQLAKTFRASLSVSHVLSDNGFIADFNEEDRLKAFSLALGAETFNGVGLRILEGNSIVAEEEKLQDSCKFNLLVLVHRRHQLLHELFHASHCKAFIKNQRSTILVMPEDWDGKSCLLKLKRRTPG